MLIKKIEKCQICVFEDRYIHDCDKPFAHEGNHRCEQHKIEWDGKGNLFKDKNIVSGEKDAPV